MSVLWGRVREKTPKSSPPLLPPKKKLDGKTPTQILLHRLCRSELTQPLKFKQTARRTPGSRMEVAERLDFFSSSFFGRRRRGEEEGCWVWFFFGEKGGRQGFEVVAKQPSLCVQSRLYACYVCDMLLFMCMCICI